LSGRRIFGTRHVVQRETPAAAIGRLHRAVDVRGVVFGGADGGVGDLGHAEQGGKDEPGGDAEVGAQTKQFTEEAAGGGAEDAVGGLCVAGARRRRRSTGRW
jgi:hypothetical protein